MENFKINDLVQIIINKIRDESIKNLDIQLKFNNLNSPIAKRWKQALDNGDINEFGRRIIVDSVDEALFNLFYSIDEGDLPLLFRKKQNEIIDIAELGEGELAGNYSGFWKYELSEERNHYDLEWGEK